MSGAALQIIVIRKGAFISLESARNLLRNHCREKVV